ncbi:30S ribosomal protein S12 methylthiotransferase RimO [Prevotella lacticifex]|uniref:Ribosomal protein uS12 methylthiotransferase RimO n=1 Tax=Prevotella lacticifex TaxID=2854755 RepID=A0A9R1CAK8_9BACT|nr:30S ribosomal protein S12 methylthiotransferase RimO [Prevotella lacticifex]GJG35915.1 ribosomal protein S12 methylthiotransferase RimO [Prevotella lacticifex]GJG39035.1 ribosomal protein S12 methylthiotransferase RimO [Prevotella lacticifex]GJG42284.1 ribosomal protein S12 methylthiotransferase RimO [Prevotella lacticifex]GJG45390.1 ribosomal protein S12 methylthiotransferase RimO [Prevotella lacticifex]GJG48635.1 ribosomal protein S12 methylthiotransferase RimO [Prevotella lacticifex]
MKKNRIDFITMGCSKNLVDSEKLMRKFADEGYDCVHDPKRPQGEIAVINTCGFIESAKEESINTILEFVERKKRGRLQKLYVMGCLSQRYRDELEKEIPEVDKFYGKFDYNQLLSDLGPIRSNIAVDSSIASQRSSRLQTTPKHYAYIKIAEGCDRHCAYCAIPLITGKHHSRPMEDVLAEVRDLVAQGVKEFQVIEQELTYYGVDIYGKTKIAELISQMADIEGVEWIRLHYAYPNQFPLELLDVMREKPNVCKYLDIALQHISDHMLQLMHRHVTKEETIALIHTIRERVPGINIRTTLMVGFPGETDEDFEELMDFVREERFERMGAFAYSEEEGTYSAEHYADDVPAEVKQERLDRLMALQEEISADVEAAKVGTTMKVIVDRREGDYYVARTEFCSPEVDPEVLIPANERRLIVGNFYDVLITGSDDYDLFATTNTTRK